MANYSKQMLNWNDMFLIYFLEYIDLILMKNVSFRVLTSMNSFLSSWFRAWLCSPTFWFNFIRFYPFFLFPLLLMKILHLSWFSKFLSNFLFLAVALLPLVWLLLWTLLYYCLRNELLLPISLPLFVLTHSINIIPEHHLFLFPLFFVSLRLHSVLS